MEIKLIPFPNKKYKIILADPPWEYEDKALAANRGAGCKYDVMNINDICNLPVQNIADENCVLLIWGTWVMSMNGRIQQVIKEWGFTPKTCAFTWVKRYSNGKLFYGMGNWTRSNTEFILLATKGKPKRINAGIGQVIEAMPQKHSQKPNIFRNKILELFGDLPRIELFARTRVHGWDTWGNDEKLKNQPLEAFV